MFEITPEDLNQITRLLVAAVLGGAIGFERDIHGRAAGLRTHLLVCAGSALFVLLSMSFDSLVPRGTGYSTVPGDPARIAAQVVTGIGFLGAGAIVKAGTTIRGLTTAACLWMTAAIGMTAGAGLFTLATVSTVLALCCLVFLNRVERFYRKDSYRHLSLICGIDTDVRNLIDTVSRREVSVVHVDLKRDYSDQTLSLRLALRICHRGITDKLAHSVIKDLEDAKFSLKTVGWSS